MRNIDHLLVLFHDRRKISQKALSALEDIDDDCDDLGVSFVEVMMHNLMFGFKAFFVFEYLYHIYNLFLFLKYLG